jgi:RNA exonuclease 4
LAQRCKAEAEKFDAVQRTVAEMIKDKVVVGHSLWNDLSGGYPWSRGIVFQESVAIALNRRFICYYFLVLGIPHPAVNTRDVALYQPFRNALRQPNQLVRLPTLTFHLMGRRCQEGQQNPVRCII